MRRRPVREVMPLSGLFVPRDGRVGLFCDSTLLL